MTVESYETYEHDVLVIGAGGAGLRAAIEAQAQGASVGVVCKSLLGKAHTVMAEGGVAAALATTRSEDGWQVHFRDTMRGGKGVNDWRMARIHAQEAPERVIELEAWGALWDRQDDGRISQRPFGGHTYARLAHVGDRTGLEMIRTLQDQAVHDGVTVYMECTVIRLFKDGDRIAGALAYWRQSGRFVLFRAKAVVLATGGGGKAWLITSNSWEYTGDGHALALAAGADLIHMEFVQFHPTGMVWPPSVRGTLVTEGVRGEGGVLLNAKGERFMFRAMPDAFRNEYAADEAEADRWVYGDRKANRRPPELFTRDMVSRAIEVEVAEGRGTGHGGVYLDIASKQSPEHIKKKLPSMYHQFKELAGVDITREPMEVGPTTHYFMGGIKVDPETEESTVPGLFAAGEVAGGLHGANRLGGNSLSDLLVFGQRAGLGAAQYARRLSAPPTVDRSAVEEGMRDALVPFERGEGENPFAIQDELRHLMQEKVGIARTKDGLEAALDRLFKLRERLARCRVTGGREYNPGWNTCLDLESLLTTSEVVARAALERTESRGAHTRDDYPKSDPGLGRQNVVVYMDAGRVATRREPVPEPPPELKRLIEEGVPGA
ncbi:MAG: fumarate reductase/succinate dehydrogenase flavoprotein subunit [Gemmatimonadetes bacterium]|nr:fumarate reductase/succinate dehydrogenase flavoprotein subunit [Gemmatimonadota bacterium]